MNTNLLRKNINTAVFENIKDVTLLVCKVIISTEVKINMSQNQYQQQILLQFRAIDYFKKFRKEGILETGKKFRIKIVQNVLWPGIAIIQTIERKRIISPYILYWSEV